MAFGKVGISRWTVAIKKMELKFDFKSALNSRISIHPLRIVGAQVQLSESDKAKEQKSTFQFPSKLRSLHVEDISVRQGEFTYIDINAAKRKGILTFKDIDVDTMKGFRAWRAAACDRCHGANQEGMVGPSLIESLKRLSKDDFVVVIRDGRLEKGMQAFKDSKIVMDNVDHLYAYLKGRSDGAITQAKVTEIK